MTPPTSSPQTEHDWEMYRVLREQWTHEDNLVNHRVMWLILSEGLLLTAYGTLSTSHLYWMIFGFPFFGVVVTILIGASIFAALHATKMIRKQYDQRGLSAFYPLTPAGRFHGTWAARALPIVFCALWLLALAGRIAAL